MEVRTLPIEGDRSFKRVLSSSSSAVLDTAWATKTMPPRITAAVEAASYPRALELSWSLGS